MLKASALCAGASLLALGVGVSAAAQSPQSDPITNCRENTYTEAERIACLEAALVGGAAPVAPAAPVTSAAAAPSIAVSPEASAEAVTGLGAEQVGSKEKKKRVRKEREDERTLSPLASFEYDAFDAMTFYLENGQVWRQKFTDKKIRLSKNQSYTVQVQRGAVTGYKLTIKERNITVRAERLK